LKLAEFVLQYDKIIFDMDGVITSEQNYWTVSALTVYEWLESKRFLGSGEPDLAWMYDTAGEIRAKVFCNDRIISLIKDIGVNSNWDLVYITVAMWLCYGSYEAVCRHLETTDYDVDGLYARCAELLTQHTGKDLEYTKRNGELWQQMVNCFQEWYLGDEEYYTYYGKQAGEQLTLRGKKPMRFCEVPLVDIQRLKQLLYLCNQHGITLGIATGRPRLEQETPLQIWEMEQYFDPKYIATYDEVIMAESALHLPEQGRNLGKPNPYVFAKAALGVKSSDADIVAGNYTLPGKVLAVGDAGCDILAAKDAGMDFLAVLTGVGGEKTRPYFERMDADYILDCITDLLED